jgi:hypothetical protein
MVSYVAGFVLDAGVSPRRLVFAAGVFMLIPFTAWTLAQRFWRERVLAEAGDSAARS